MWLWAGAGAVEGPLVGGAGPIPALLVLLNSGVPYSSALVAAALLLLLPPAPIEEPPRPSLRRNGVSSNVYSGSVCGIAYPVDT